MDDLGFSIRATSFFSVHKGKASKGERYPSQGNRKLANIFEGLHLISFALEPGVKLKELMEGMPGGNYKYFVLDLSVTLISVGITLLLFL